MMLDLSRLNLDELEGQSKPKALGPDEQQLIDALKIKEDRTDWEKARGQFKIEVFFTKTRSIVEPTNNGAITLYESGRRFNGEGDERMVRCGHEGCKMPIKSSYMGHLHLTCPHCGGTNYLDEDSKNSIIAYAKREGRNTKVFESHPIISGPIFFYNLPIKKVAAICADQYAKLNGMADLYVKFAKTDIRNYDAPNLGTRVEGFKKARIDRNIGGKGLLMPMVNIHKDLANGQSVDRIMLRALTA